MAQTVVWNASSGTTVRRNRSSGATAGQGQSKRWYVGRHGSYDYDAYVKFSQSWSGGTDPGLMAGIFSCSNVNRSDSGLPPHLARNVGPTRAGPAAPVRSGRWH